MSATHPLGLLAIVQDTVAYVTRPGGPPDSSGYMWAGYAVTALAYGGYLVLLLRRMSRERDRDRGSPRAAPHG